jgi:hypothetical protein
MCMSIGERRRTIYIEPIEEPTASPVEQPSPPIVPTPSDPRPDPELEPVR